MYIFTYTDLCELPMMIEQMFKHSPLAIFMFIPANSFKKAFELMKDIFERHRIRMKDNHLEIQQQTLLFSPETLACSVQLTLIRALNVPIPLFMPMYQ